MNCVGGRGPWEGKAGDWGSGLWNAEYILAKSESKAACGDGGTIPAGAEKGLLGVLMLGKFELAAAAENGFGLK